MNHAKTIVLGNFGTLDVNRSGYMNVMDIVHQGNVVRKKKGLKEISYDDVLDNTDLREFLLSFSEVDKDNGSRDVSKAFPDLFKKSSKCVLTVIEPVGLKIASSMDVELEAFLMDIFVSHLLGR